VACPWTPGYDVAAGAVETQMLRGPFPDFPPDRTLSPGDAAEMIFILAQPGCAYATGQVVTVRK
jgi:NAD(P)-dependent dehydrogenase (short-subunit alcohol dehydrogenase family)